MRKFWVPVLFLAATVQIAAQLPSGTIAPDFKVKDLNGQNWQLYELLDKGKIVVLEISATWCAPCWAYHNGKAMHHFYEQHGPEGDDKARVLFIEGDPKTNVNCLYGLGGCNDFTPGNWVAGTPFPIINDDSIAKTYSIEYFPTIYVICPNRKIYETGQWNAADLWTQASTCPVASGSRNAGIYNYSAGTELRDVCGTLNAKPAFSLINLGTDALTQATLALKWNDNILQTINWNGHLNLYEEAQISFNAIPLADNGQLTTALLDVNYAPADDDPANNVRSDSFYTAKNFKGLNVLLKVRTDQYGAETYWELRDEQGIVLESGGNKDVGPNGGGMYNGITEGPGAYNNNTTVRDTLNLPGPGCYSIHFVDYYGDGICCEYGNGFYKLYNLDDQTVPILSGGTFRAYDDRAFSAGVFTASQEVIRLPSLLLYPNPANQQLYTEFALPGNASVSASIVNALGQAVRQLPAEMLDAGEHQQELSVGALPEGLYWFRLQVNGQTVSRKFILQR